MKKVKLVMVTALALVLFAGCKQKPQEEFTAELAKQSEMNAGSYSIVIDKMTISGEGEDARTRASMDLGAKMISGTKISGDYLKDSEKKRIAMDMNIDVLGQKIPMDFFMDQKKKSMYLSTDFMTETVNIMKEFNAEMAFDEKEIEKLKGKYVQMTEEDMKKNANNKTDTSLAYENFDWEFLGNYLNTLDSDSFEKKDDTIKRTFTKKDIKGYIDYAKENGSKEEKKAVKELEKNLDDLTKYEQTTTLNTKKHTQKTKMKIAAKNDDSTVSMDLTMNSQAKDSKKKITLPKSADTISMEEFQKILDDAQKNESLVSEEEFNELLDAIKQGRGQFTQAQIDQIKSTYKPYLTEEQFKQLEEALDQSIETAA
ncbi:hypothetical protein [Enterococcus avium]|uniref:hypothetical protein n=1 Tax=Enterococcus avium TaxID=33945 RepID=UPI002890BB10|nr:hypothetical protein [Enterococcus avium]MDT2495760.1 hypothetical protein [Enterococcus avium]